MLNKYKKIFIAIAILLLIIIVFFGFTYKEQTGRLIDKTNLTNDSYVFKIDTELLNDIYIYWLGEDGMGDYNKMLIYNKSLLATIPPSYGANRILIKYDNIEFNKIGIWKKFAYSKHNYFIELNRIDSFLIIDWKISNWYEKNIMQGSDTLILNN